VKLPSYLELDKSGACLLRLWIQPKASRTGWAGMHGDRLKVRVAAPPAENRANRELIAFLAKALGLAPSMIELVSGSASRGKTVRIVEIQAGELLARMPDEP
jgi:uncharacterized protein (TIGR00251 family)